jgi:hypothetical protein
MDRSSIAGPALLGLLVGGGIALAGIVASGAVKELRASQRFVTVKGLAEREVDADLAIWPVSFKEAADDLAVLQRRVDERRGTVAAFLEGAGFRREDVSFGAPRIQDLHAERMQAGVQANRLRYLAQAAVTVRSKDVPRVRKAMEQSGVLVGRGVMLAQDWEARPQFLFTGLNAIKPAMIEEATVAAREAAAKFAKDSGSKVGKIRNASQGLFTIGDRDPNSPERKVVRVVTTVEYFLDD